VKFTLGFTKTAIEELEKLKKDAGLKKKYIIKENIVRFGKR